MKSSFLKRFIVSLSIFTSLFLLSSKSVLAETIKNFDVEIVAHKDGTMDIKENIVYDFEKEQKHGIFRNIPLVSRVGDLYRVVKIDFKEILRDGEKEKFTDQSNKSEASVKIGSSKTLITGSHSYTIFYQVQNGIGSNFADHDEIYWNITGNEWKVPIIKASAKISTDFGAVPDKATCYTGTSGSKEKNCDTTNILFISSGSLDPFQGLTAVWSFSKGTFPQSILQKENPSRPKEIPWILLGAVFLGVSFLLNLIIAPALFIWYWKNKRKKSLGEPAVSFDIPKDSKGNRVTPAEAGSIDIYRVDQNDVVATIFDLAIRKYLRIEQVKKNKTLGIFGEDEDYKVTKLKNYEDGENFEKILLDKLFEKGN